MVSLSEFAEDQLWCGVFQGGGARGAAYGGALEAVRAHGQWFKAVAGSSAGAITATLVAAGFEPDDIQRITPAMLTAVRPRTILGRFAQRIGLQHLASHDSEGLEASIDVLLRAALGRPATDHASVSFADLYAATGIRLYVIVTDASTGTPYPFCAETTPAVSVATAVAASCSIPVVFAPRYAVTDAGPVGGPAVRQLHDGGLWANFPSFVFSDPAFRAYFGLDPALDGKILGFTLIYDAVLPTRIDRFVDIPRQRRSLVHQLAQPTTGAATAADPVRGFLAVIRRGLLPLICFLGAGLLLLLVPGQLESVLPAAVLGVVGVISVEAFSWRIFRAVAPTTPILLGGLFLMYAVRILQGGPGPTTMLPAILIVAVALALIAVGLASYPLLDRAATGLQGALRVFSGQAIRPAPWVDSLPGSHLIVVPTGQLTVLSFHASPAAVAEAVADARNACLSQIATILSEQRHTLAGQLADILAKRHNLSQTSTAVPSVGDLPDHRIRSQRGRELRRRP